MDISSLSSLSLQDIEHDYHSLYDKKIKVNGWILSTRSQKDITFIKLNDGTNSNGIQLILTTYTQDNLTIGTSISCTGTLVRSPAQGQAYEIHVDELCIVGKCEGDEYPLSKSKMGLDYLRKFAHLRTRTSSFGSIFRIKSNISFATHLFFHENGYHHINPNIVTRNECEGGAGVFHITEHDLSDHKNVPCVINTSKHDYTRDHFNTPAFLTVSSQLELEALACSLGAVYTTNKSFRAEHSSTHKHLSEFEHLEIENIFTSLDQLMDIAEKYIMFVGSYLLRHSGNDIENLGKFISKGLRDRIVRIIQTPFVRISYTEAIEILQKAPDLSKPVVYGEDLCSEFENYLTDHFKTGVFVRDWPSSIKSFYMKQLLDDNTNVPKCSNFDLIMPYGIGELIGGSEREDKLDVLLNLMKEKGVNEEPLRWYTDLRRFGSVPHAGFGLGLDRLCMMFTGMENIKDCVAFPVHYKHCEY